MASAAPPIGLMDASEAEAAIGAVLGLAVASPWRGRRVVRRERDRARAIRAVAPGVIGAALHDGVAGLEVNLLGIEHQGDLALEYQAEIERARSLHVGMRGLRGIGRGSRRAHRREIGRDLAPADLSAVARLRRKRH